MGYFQFQALGLIYGSGEFLLDPKIIALVSAALGGIFLKTFDLILLKYGKTADIATIIREELRKENRDQKADIDRLETENIAWRDRYYTLLEKCQEETNNLKLKITKLTAKLGIDETDLE